MDLFNMQGKITVDGNDTAIDRINEVAAAASKTADTLGTKLTTIGSKLSMWGAGLTLAVTTPLTMLGSSMITAASDYEENINKLDVAFGNSSQSVKDWASGATEQFGLSKNAAMEMTAQFGDMATSMGYTQGDAADLATGLAGLAGDLSSFKNIGVDQAMTALNGVFTGETESLKTLGIVMTQTNLDAFALANGFGKTTKEMSQSELVALRYAYVMEMTKNAHGDYARTADGTANSTRTFQASIENLKIALGQKLLPIFTPIVQKLTDLVNAFAEAPSWVQTFVLALGGIAAAAGPVMSVVGGIMIGVSKMMPLFAKASEVVAKLAPKFNTFRSAVTLCGGGVRGFLTAIFGLMGPIGWIITAVTAVVGVFAHLWKTNEGFKSSMLDLWGQIKSIVMPLIESFKGSMSDLSGKVMPMITGALDVVKGAFNSVAEVIGNVMIKIVEIAIPVIQKIVDAIQEGMPFIKSIVVGAMDAIQKVIQIVWPVVQEIVTRAMSIIKEIIEKAWPAISSAIELAMSIIQGVIGTVWPIVKGIIEAAMKFIHGIIDTVMKIIEGDWEGAWNTIKGALSDAWESIKTGVSNGISNLMDSIQELPGKIKNVFSDAGTWLLDAGANIISGLWDGINDAMSWLGDKLAGIGDFIQAHKGPPEYDAKLLVDNGKLIMRSLSDGFTAGLPQVEKTLSGITDDIKAGVDLSGAITPTATQTAAQTSYNAISGKRTQTDSNSVEMQAKFDTMIALLQSLVDKDPAAKLYLDKKQLTTELLPEIDKGLGKLTTRRAYGL